MNVKKSDKSFQIEKSGAQITHKALALKFLIQLLGNYLGSIYYHYYLFTRRPAHEIHVSVWSLGLACDQGHLSCPPVPPTLAPCSPSSDQTLMAGERD